MGRAVYSRFKPVPPHGVPNAFLLNLPLEEVADCSVVLNLKQTTPFHCQQVTVTLWFGSCKYSGPPSTVWKGANRSGRAGRNGRCKRSGG